MTRQVTSPDGLPYYQATDTPDGAAQQQDLAATLQSVLTARVPSDLTGALLAPTFSTTATAIGNAITVVKAGLYLIQASPVLFNNYAGDQDVTIEVRNPAAAVVASQKRRIHTAANPYHYPTVTRVVRLTSTGSYTLVAYGSLGSITALNTWMNPATWSLTWLSA